MKFVVYRTSGYYPPTETCFKDAEFYDKYDDKCVRYCEYIDSIESLMNFVKENGETIIKQLDSSGAKWFNVPEGTFALEIYDDYRE